jgi:hypothetical protein
MIRNVLKRNVLGAVLVIVVLFSIAPAGFGMHHYQTYHRHYYVYHHHSKLKGALVGGAGGALVGGLIGGGKGALIGGGAGAGTGYLVQRYRNHHQHRHYVYR